LGDHAQDADQVYEHDWHHVRGEVRVIEVWVLLRYAHDGGDQLEDDGGREQDDHIRIGRQPATWVPGSEQQPGGHVQHVDGPGQPDQHQGHDDRADDRVRQQHAENATVVVLGAVERLALHECFAQVEAHSDERPHLQCQLGGPQYQAAVAHVKTSVADCDNTLLLLLL